MPQPYNYTLKTYPGGLIRGAQAARDYQGKGAQRDQMIAAARAQEIKNAQFEAQKSKEEEKRRQLMKFVGKKDKTQQDHIDFMLLFPDRYKQIKTSYDNLGEEEKKSEIKNISSIYTPISQGNIELAKERAEKMAQGYENSGMDQDAAETRDMIKMMETNPRVLKQEMETGLAYLMGADEYGKIVKTRQSEELHPGAIEQQEADIKLSESKAVESGSSAALKDYQAADIGKKLGLTDAEINKTIKQTEKLGAETQKILLEIKSLQKTGGLDPEKKFKMEKDIRTEYQKRTSGYIESKQQLEKMKASPIQNPSKRGAVEKGRATGASDTALVFSFMKMLDPGSVVRESEFAQAQKTGNLYDYLKGLVSQKTEGTFLTPKTRANFQNLAQKYMDAAEKHEKGVRKDLEYNADQYNLNRRNIFGAKATPRPNADVVIDDEVSKILQEIKAETQ